MTEPTDPTEERADHNPAYWFKARAFAAASALDQLVQLGKQEAWDMTIEMLKERRIDKAVQAKLFGPRRVK